MPSPDDKHAPPVRFAVLCRVSAAPAGCPWHLQIQAVARPPAALNGRKGVTAAFSTLGVIYPLVAVAGFYVRACLDCCLFVSCS
jgi:hypothetical protein